MTAAGEAPDAPQRRTDTLALSGREALSPRGGSLRAIDRQRPITRPPSEAGDAVAVRRLAFRDAMRWLWVTARQIDCAATLSEGMPPGRGLAGVEFVNSFVADAADRIAAWRGVQARPDLPSPVGSTALQASRLCVQRRMTRVRMVAQSAPEALLKRRSVVRKPRRPERPCLTLASVTAVLTVMVSPARIGSKNA